MQFELKFKSIAVRWFVNVFLIVAIIVTGMVIGFSVSYSSIYRERIRNTADSYAEEFSALSNATKQTFYASAVAISANFAYKDKIEVQAINADGKIVLSTTGFQSADTITSMPDYDEALKSKSGTAYFNGKSQNGESIMARTVLVKDSSGKHIGAYRWITSMEPFYARTTTTTVAAILVGTLFLALSAFSGLYFTRSIIIPIRDVSNMARKIAAGDFESRIEIEKNDEIGELCDTINYMASELSETQNLKNDFISSVSHELRTPLTAIRGWGETAKMSVGTDDELVSRGLDVVLSEADRLSGLVEDLLDFSRMENGRLTLLEAPVDVTLLLNEAADMYTELARKQGIDLIITRASHPKMVMGDHDRLKQVFINIIDNAVKYTENGGQVLVEQLSDEACVKVVVTDTGVGIPAQDLDRVKEKFYKANKTVRGSGIGLAVADEIIKQHKGLLFVESTEGVGTKVTIVLPVIDEVSDNKKTEQENL